MKLLADENFPRPTVEILRREGHDVLWARLDCPGVTDRDLLERAEGDGRLLLTLEGFLATSAPAGRFLSNDAE
jgi:predicted nuclease of predicted toxin-antitoxin system